MPPLLVCPMCGHEWSAEEATADASGSAGSAGSGADSGEPVVRDSVGNILSDGDTVTIVTSLKV